MDLWLTGMGFKGSTVSSILTDGEIDWQVSNESLIFSAYLTIDTADANNYQNQIAKLSHHWQTWQTKARAEIRKHFNIEPKIYPLLCSHVVNEKQFHPNGLQISKELENLILNKDPQIRSSIDWLGISTGRKK